MKPEYKQTEVGLIPQEWDVRALHDLLKNPPKYGINAPAVIYRGDLPVYIRITDISEDGYFDPEPIVSVDHPDSVDYYLEEGDIVFARTGASVGKSYLYNHLDGELVFAGFLIRIRPDKRKLLPDFLAQFVKTRTYWNWVQLMSMRSGQPGINGNEYGQMCIPVPSIGEQRAIAAALGDVDDLIAALDKLIAKKRAVKKAAMQELLTGRTRLPGFSGEWQNTPLREVCWFQEGPGVRTAQFKKIGVKLLNGTNIFKGHIYLDKTNRFISFDEAKGAYSHFLAEEGDIVIACSGITVERFDEKVAFVRKDHLPLCMNTSTMRFQSLYGRLVQGFLYQYLMSDNFKLQIAGQATGSAQLNFGLTFQK